MVARAVVVAQVRVGLAWGVPPGGRDGIPPFVGAAGAAVDAHQAAGLPLDPLLPGRAAQMLLVCALAGFVLGLPAGVVGFAAGVADHIEERLVVRPAEAPEHRRGRSVLLHTRGAQLGERATLTWIPGGSPSRSCRRTLALVHPDHRGRYATVLALD